MCARARKMYLECHIDGQLRRLPIIRVGISAQSQDWHVNAAIQTHFVVHHLCLLSLSVLRQLTMGVGTSLPPYKYTPQVNFIDRNMISLCMMTSFIPPHSRELTYVGINYVTYIALYIICCIY